jgi:hypothetical protein
MVSKRPFNDINDGAHNMCMSLDAHQSGRNRTQQLSIQQAANKIAKTDDAQRPTQTDAAGT